MISTCFAVWQRSVYGPSKYLQQENISLHLRSPFSYAVNNAQVITGTKAYIVRTDRGFVGVRLLDRIAGCGRLRDLKGHKTSRLSLKIVWQNLRKVVLWFNTAIFKQSRRHNENLKRLFFRTEVRLRYLSRTSLYNTWRHWMSGPVGRKLHFSPCSNSPTSSYNIHSCKSNWSFLQVLHLNKNVLKTNYYWK